MSLHIVDAVEKKFAEKNKDKTMPDFQKSKAREMERAFDNFMTALRHFSELDGDVDLSEIKREIKEEIERELR